MYLGRHRLSDYSLLLYCWKRVFAMTTVFSWQNSISLCPASFHIPRPNLPVAPGVSWLPTFAFQSPIMKRTSFWVLVLEGFVGLHRTIQLQLLQLYWLRHRLGLQVGWHPTISSSVVPFSPHLQSFPASGSFQMSQLFASGHQSFGVLASASVLPMNIQDWFPLGCTGWIFLQSKGLSRVFFNTTVQKHQFFGAQLSPTLTPIHDHRKNHSLD